MEELGFSETELDEIFRYLAAILLTGNLTFKATSERAGDPGCKLADDSDARLVAQLWQVDLAQLKSTFTRRTLEVMARAPSPPIV